MYDSYLARFEHPKHRPMWTVIIIIYIDSAYFSIIETIIHYLSTKKSYCTMSKISSTVLRRGLTLPRRWLSCGPKINTHHPRLLFARPLASLHQKNSSIRQFSSSSSEITKPPSSDVVPTSSSNDILFSKDGVSGKRIDFDVQAKIEGNESQIITITLYPGQVLRAESGAMMYMTEGVEMNTTTGGGLSAGFQRMLTGQNMFVSDYTYTGNDQSHGQVALGTDFPSKIVRVPVPEYGGKIVCQKGALLCASHTIDIQMEFSKNFSTGFFGGEGFVLQGLTGDGDVFVKAGGTLIRRDLREGEQLRISSGCLVAFSAGVDYGMY